MKRLSACGLPVVVLLALAVTASPAMGQTTESRGALEQRLSRIPPRDPGSQAYTRGDYATALRLWGEAARRGDAVAQYNVGLMYAFGLGVHKNMETAAAWYRKSADQGYDKAQAVLGLLYATGVGVPRDTQEAVRWWKLAAAQGNADARFNLGMSYWSGEGVPQDFDAAAEQFRKSVPAGSPYGRTVLGTQSSNGGSAAPEKGAPPAGARGGNATGDAATVTFRRTLDRAEAGDTLAQSRLGYYYAVGLGVQRNLAEAYMWNNIAAARLPPGPVRDAAVRNRNAAAARLSADEILRAQRRARRWMDVFNAKR